MELELKVSLVGDGSYSKVVLMSVPLKGKRGKSIDLILGLIKEVEKEDEEEKGVDMKRK